MNPMVGKTIDNYHILEVIGRGGMGIVFKAMDESLEKIVALKMIDPFLAQDENFLRRFKREARALARLENPNIVTVYALRETSEGLFMVMEYVDAMTVSDWIRKNGAFQWRDAVIYGKQMVDALRHAHQVGVIHRDIKPSNIMLTTDGKVKITDFGLAKVIRQHGHESTVTQATAGTLYYMSPEQVKGLKNVDFRSDLYSLGMTIYEMLVGQPPFEETDSDFSIQKKIVEGDIPAPSKMNKELPDPLVKIIQKTISTDPGKRYQSAGEMLEALEAFQESKAWTAPVKKKTRPLITKKAGLIATLLFTFSTVIVLFATGIIKVGGLGGEGNFAAIAIETTPSDASVFLNSDSVGTSPITIDSIIAGKTSISIRRSGFQSLDTSVTLRRSRKAVFNFTLPPLREPLATAEPKSTTQTATLGIRSQPNGASIWLDGDYLGTSPQTKSLTPGSHQVRVEKEGFVNYSRDVSIEEGQSLEIVARLTEVPKVTGSLRIDSQPQGARIFRDGQMTNNQTPHTITGLTPGRNDISVRLDGYSSFDTTVAIEEGETTVLLARLRPALGDLNITVRPFGSISIDGKLVKENIPYYRTTLTSGRHTVTAMHNTFGEWDKNIIVKPGDNQDIQFDFNQIFSVTVTSKPDLAQIYVDKELCSDSMDRPLLTPKMIEVRAGKHTISVQKEGFTLVDGDRILNIEHDLIDTASIQFELKKSD